MTDLREWMQTHGYTVRALAEALGTSPATIQRWRDGREPEHPAMLALALEALEHRVLDAFDLPPGTYSGVITRAEAKGDLIRTTWAVETPQGVREVRVVQSAPGVGEPESP